MEVYKIKEGTVVSLVLIDDYNECYIASLLVGQNNYTNLHYIVGLVIDKGQEIPFEEVAIGIIEEYKEISIKALENKEFTEADIDRASERVKKLFPNLTFGHNYGGVTHE